MLPPSVTHITSAFPMVEVLCAMMSVVQSGEAVPAACCTIHSDTLSSQLVIP